MHLMYILVGTQKIKKMHLFYNFFFQPNILPIFQQTYTIFAINLIEQTLYW